MKHAPLVLLAVLAALLAPTGFAQDHPQVVPVDGPVTYLGTYDLATQTMIPPDADPADGSAVVLDNIEFLGSFFQPGAGFINMDWGDLAAGGFNDITDIQIGYGTETLGTVDIQISLHEGATGFGDAGSTITQFLIEGLPGSASGLPEAFAFDISLGGATNLADGPIGWGYEFFDAGTGPLLVGPPNPPGVIDAFDQYLSDLTYVGTFNFGGPPAPLASFYMQMTGTTPGPTCQTDLGGAGDGSMTLQVCGDPLDTRADIALLEVDGAPANADVYLLAGLVDAPTSFAGGTLHPNPALIVVTVSADGTGHFEAEVRGGGGPVTVYLQAAAIDGTTPSGKALSNALALDFGP